MAGIYPIYLPELLGSSSLVSAIVYVEAPTEKQMCGSESRPRIPTVKHKTPGYHR